MATAQWYNRDQRVGIQAEDTAEEEENNSNHHTRHLPPGAQLPPLQSEARAPLKGGKAVASFQRGDSTTQEIFEGLEKIRAEEEKQARAERKEQDPDGNEEEDELTELANKMPEIDKDAVRESRRRSKMLLHEHNNASERDYREKLADRRRKAHKEVEAMRQRVKQSPYLITPDGPLMSKWDIVTFGALVFTAICTPFEVSLLETSVHRDEFVILFVINRVVDLIFYVDMGFLFFTAYVDEAQVVVKELPKIRKHYLTTWFPLDFISVLPFDIVALAAKGGAQADTFNALKIVRSLRLFRLLKLARIFKASRIARRFEERSALPYTIIGLIKFSVILVVVGHWMACAWILVATTQEDPKCHAWKDDDEGGCHTWMDELWGNMKDERRATPLTKYSAAIYWSLVTITSVGYGDIIPTNDHEARWATILLLFGSCLWAYIIGNVCGIVSNLDIETLNHQQTMDQLNDFMNDRNIPKELKKELRRYFNMRKELAKNDSFKKLINAMSPQLKSEISKLHSSWLMRAYFFSSCTQNFIVAITEEVTNSVFIPKEEIGWTDSLNCVSRGVASWGGRVITHGSHWGDDFILEGLLLKRMTSAFSLTYIELLTLSHESMYEILQMFPKDQQIVRRAVVHMAVHRGVLYHAKKLGMLSGGKAHKVTKNMSEKWGNDVAEAEKRVKDELENNSRFHRSAQRSLSQNATGASSNNLFSLVSDSMMGGTSSGGRFASSAMQMQSSFSDVNAESIRRVENKVESLVAMMRNNTRSAAAERALQGAETKSPSSGPSPKSPDSQGFLSSEIIDAIKVGNLKKLGELIQNGADVDAISEGTTPLLAAIEGNFIAAITLLVENGANVEIGSPPAIEMAVETADIPAVTVMLKYPLQVLSYSELKDFALRHNHLQLADIFEVYEGKAR